MGSIDDYLRERPDATGQAIAAAYAVASGLAPEAEQGVKYAMPALVLGGKGVISIMQTAKHIGVYPHSSAVVETVGEVPGMIGSSKGALQFPLGRRIPDEAITALVRARLGELGA